MIQFVRYFRDGDRDDQQNAYSALRERLALAALAAAYTGEDHWIDEAGDGAAMLCEMLSWCWAAHDEFIAEVGQVVPDPDRPFLDLGAAEAASELAWVDHLMAGFFDDRLPGLRRLIRREVNHRVIEPFMDQGWWWVREPTSVNNWNPWICSQVVTAALLLEDDPDRRAAIIALAASRVDVYLASLPVDGGIDEGFAYWWQGMGRLLELLDLLDRASGGAVAIDHVEALRQAAAYPMRMRWSRDWHINSGDGPARAHDHLPWHILHRFARRVGDDTLAQAARAYRDPDHAGFTILDSMGLGRAVTCLTDPDWLAAAPGRASDVAAPPLGPATAAWHAQFPDVWLPTSQIAVVHGKGGLSFSIKGAHNDQSHNHNDVGNLTVAVDGVPYVVDAGAPTYTSQTFSDRRYDLWPMRSGWHNVPAPFGAEQPFGRVWHADAMTFERGADQACQVDIEVAGAYDLPEVASWVRTVRLDPAGTRLVVREKATIARLTDSPSTDEPPATTAQPRPTDPLMTVRYLLAGPVTLGKGHIDCGGAEAEPVPQVEGPWIATPIRPADAPTPRLLRLTWPDGVTAEVEEHPLTDPRLVRVWGTRLTRLTLRGTPTQDTLTVTMEAQA